MEDEKSWGHKLYSILFLDLLTKRWKTDFKNRKKYISALNQFYLLAIVSAHSSVDTNDKFYDSI